jgi:hypothetical protein
MNALCWYRLGADFADALHLANAEGLPFYTFDGRFCKMPLKKALRQAFRFCKKTIRSEANAGT